MFENKINKYLVSSFWYILAIGTGYLISFGGNILFTHIMSQEHYGLYTNYYSIVVLLCPFVGANLFVGLQNGFFDFKEKQKEFRSCVLFLSVLFFLVFSALTLFFNKAFSVNFPTIILLLALIHAYSFFVINYFNVYENLCNNYKIRGLLLFLQNFIQFILPLLFVLFINKNSYYERVFGSVLGLAIISFILIIIVYTQSKKLFNLEYYKYVLKISLPSILASVSSLAMQNCDHIMITYMCGAEYTAVYGFMYNIGNVVLLILAGVGGPVTAWVYNALDTERINTAKIGQKWYLLFFVAMVALILMVFPEFIELATPRAYWDFRYIPPFVMGSSIAVLNTLHGDVITFYKKTGSISGCVGIAAICNLILNLYFIKKYGAVAAAYTSFVSYLLQASLYRIVLKGIRKNIFSDLYSGLYLLTIIILCILFYFLYKYIFLRYIIYSFVLFVLLIMAFMKQKEVKNLIKA